jgi:hypothetical protein
MENSIPSKLQVSEAGELRTEEEATMDMDEQLQQSAAEEDLDMADAAPKEATVDHETVKDESMEDTTKDEKKEDVKLEDLFADVDSDDEFPGSRPTGASPSSSSPGEMTPTSRYRSLSTPALPEPITDSALLQRRRRGVIQGFRPGSNEELLSATVPLALPFPVAES